MTTPNNLSQLHPSIGNIEVSIYSCGSDAASKQYLKLQDIADVIRTGRPLLLNPTRSIKSIQDELRYRQKDLERSEYQQWKAANLPMFLITGCFEYRNTSGLVGPHTSLINIDIDHIENVAALKRQIVDNESSLVLAGISPSGDGLKLVFQVTPTPTDAAEHKILAQQLQRYVSTKYQIPITSDNDGVGIDSNGTKLTFTCFFFYDPDLYVNTKLPDKFIGNIPKTVAATNDKNSENFEWGKLDSCLAFYTPDCSYEDWCDIGMALKHEGTLRDKAETFYNKWLEWSAESTTKFNPAEIKPKWDSFNIDNKNQITLGTIYYRASKTGWIAPTIQTSPRTDANNKTKDNRNLEYYAIEQNLPLHLRAFPRESSDVDRMLHYYSDRFLIVNDTEIYTRTKRGAWDLVTVEKANGRIDNILRTAREDALLEALHHKNCGLDYREHLDRSFNDTNSHIKAITGRLLALTENDQYSSIHSIKDIDFNSRSIVDPTLPLQTGAINLKTGQILTPDEYASYYQLHTPRWATEYDPEILNSNSPGTNIARYLIHDHYGVEIFSRFALHLVRTSKSVDIINMPTSNSGKTALIEWLKRAIGSVELDSRSQSLTEKGGKYSEDTAPLTEYLFYFYDEVDKLQDEIKIGVLNQMTAESLTIAKKFQNATPRTRIGTPILIGAAWPPIDAIAQGIDTRINFVYKRVTNPMSEDLKLALINDTDTHKYLLAWLVDEARQFATGKKEWKNSKESDLARAEFIEQQTPELKQILLDTYSHTSNRDDYVQMSHINDTVTALGEKTTKVNKILLEVFPGIIADRIRLEVEEGTTRRVKIYRHLRTKVTPVEDLNTVNEQPTAIPTGVASDLEDLFGSIV